MSKERPILFSGEMVRAILAGRKSQTRRIVKPQPKHRLIEGVAYRTIGMNPAEDGMNWHDADCVNPGRLVRCPYGQPGDRLWVRETWQPNTPPSGYIYRADDVAVHIESGWRSPIFMRRCASRITLEITGVRVERVQEISEADALAEGVTIPNYDKNLEPVTIGGFTSGAGRIAYKELWESINGPDSWNANPWVWVIEFRKI